MESTLSEVRDLFGKKGKRNKYLLYRNYDELQYLNEWINKPANNDVVHITMDSFVETIKNCGKCNDVSDKKIGYGSGLNGIMILLNSPRLINKFEKDMLKSDSIKLMKKIISSINLKFDECYITNLIKCDYSEVLEKPSQILENCRDFLKDEIEIMDPRIILVMGEMMPVQKLVYEKDGISWFQIEHPITLINNPDLKRPAWNTLKLLTEKIKEYNNS
ncbi:uracil-DNA glycosylase family protein [Spirochaetota bacterium]